MGSLAPLISFTGQHLGSGEVWEMSCAALIRFVLPEKRTRSSGNG